MNFSFLNSLILFGLIAAVIPILIHLFIKYKPKIIYFSSLKYIKEVQEKKSRIMRLRELLLLITRILIITLFILALARPVLQGLFSKKSRAHAPTAVALIIDNSFSMNYLEEDTPLIQSAYSLADDVLNMLNDRDRIVILSMDQDVNQRIGHVTNLSEAREILHNITISDNTSNVKDILSLADERLQDSKMINREIYLITDEQETPWKNMESSSLSSDIFVIPVPSDTSKENIASISGQYIPQILSPENKPEIRAIVKNFSANTMSDVLVTLSLNNITRAETVIELSPFQTKQLTFDVPSEENPFLFGEVRVKDELLPDDNVFYFNFAAESEPRICVISSTDLPVALSSIFDIITNNKLKVVSPTLMTERDIEQNQLFIIYAPREFNDRMKYYADNILSKGKSIFIIADEHMNERQDLTEWLNSKDIHYKTLLQDEQKIGFVNPAHPICNIITTELLQSSSIKKMWSLDTPGFIPLIATEENNSILAIKDNLLVSSIDFTKDWSDLIYQTSFPVLMYNIGYYLGSTSSQILQRETGEALTLELEGDFSCQLPNGEIVPLSLTRQNDLFTRTYQQGHYFIFNNDQLIKVLSFNTSRNESDLDQLSTEQKDLLSEQNHRIHFLGQDNWKGEILQSRYGYELWKQFFWIVLALLIIEMVLAYSGKGLLRK